MTVQGPVLTVGVYKVNLILESRILHVLSLVPRCHCQICKSTLRMHISGGECFVID